MQEFLWHIRLKLLGFYEEFRHIIWHYKITLGIYDPKFITNRYLYFFALFLEVLLILLALLLWRRTVLVIALVFAVIGVLIYSYAISTNSFVFEDYRIAHQRFHGTGVYDQTDKFLGIIPPQLDVESAEQDHKSLYVSEVPEAWWEVLKALEDRHIDDPSRSWGGIDVFALAQRSLGFLGGDDSKGASSLTMMLIRSMRHESANPNDSKLKKLRRKFTELLHAPILFKNLYPDDLKIWLAMHVPLVNGTPGSKMGAALYGIGITARIVFGKAPKDLTVAEQAMLAAAFKKPILLAPLNDESAQKLAIKRWEYLKARAKEGIKIAYPKANLQAVDELKFASQPYSPVKVASLLPKDELKKFGILANPYRRSLFFVRGEMIQAIGELQEQYGMKWRDKVYAIHLNTNTIDNVKFKRRVEKTLKSIETSLKIEQRLALNLLPTKNAEVAQVVLALANADGKLLRYYSNSQDTIYSGEQSERKDGKYIIDNETRQVASIAKLAAAVFLGAAGDNANKPNYCNKAINGVHNPGPYGSPKGLKNCSVRFSNYSPKMVFGRSLNLPLINRLKTIKKQQLALLLNNFGLQFNVKDKTPLSTAITLGLVSASPHTLHGIIHSITTGIIATPTALQPSIVQEVELITENGVIVKRQMPTMNNPDLSGIADYFAKPNTIEFVKTVLSAGLKGGNMRGTLKSLQDWTPEYNSEVELHIAKTGTSTLGKTSKNWISPILDKYIVGGIIWKGRLYSYLVLVGHSDPKKPLGKRISGNHLSPLVRVMLDSLN
ncbi:transglycosylase domain-containing protein [Candidatus Marithrix sp. Canyon 246]|uniref:transglycosylase domain-containing protein n=1 Tax=Candidatus Marithrix sp. Canyon 246 TaxID=1827136 RepID=UPI00084A2CA4|nr:transglycosylase domain-containing protein [Candidatus Marithrix sp. Canyon 246]